MCWLLEYIYMRFMNATNSIGISMYVCTNRKLMLMQYTCAFLLRSVTPLGQVYLAVLLR